MEDYCKTLGCYIGRLVGTKLTQKKLADKLNVSPQAVNQWISDKKRPRQDTLLKICAILNGSPEKAFDYAGYELDPLQKSWYMDMQINDLPLPQEYTRMKRFIEYLQRLMKGSDLRLALNFGCDVREITENFAQRDTSFLPLLFDVLDELSILYFYTSSHDEISARTGPLLKEMRIIQQQLSSNNEYLARVLLRQGKAYYMFGRNRPSDFECSLRKLRHAAKLMGEPNRLINALLFSCIVISQLGGTSLFDNNTELIEIKLEEFDGKVDAHLKRLCYSRIACASATMWDRFHQRRYSNKAMEMYYKGKTISDYTHRSGDESFITDLFVDRAELRLDISHIIELAVEERLQKAQDILARAEKLGEPKIASQMRDFLVFRGNFSPNLAYWY